MEALHAYSILYRRCTPSALSLVRCLLYVLRSFIRKIFIKQLKLIAVPGSLILLSVLNTLFV